MTDTPQQPLRHPADRAAGSMPESEYLGKDAARRGRGRWRGPASPTTETDEDPASPDPERGHTLRAAIRMGMIVPGGQRSDGPRTAAGATTGSEMTWRSTTTT